MTLPADWRSAAIAITRGFETTGDPYTMVAGDFDKMGISCGVLQWNIGKNSLQPLIRAAGQSIVLQAMPMHGAEMWDSCNSSVTRGLAIVRAWQQQNASGKPTLLAVPRTELRALMGTAEVRAQQDKAIDTKAAKALSMATKWANDRDQSQPSKRLYCLMFDFATQNGSLEGQTPRTVADFIAANRPDRVDDLICDYLGSFTGNGHKADARKNGALWRNNAAGEKLELLCLAYLRAQTANAEWQLVVINRKGSIALGRGWVNSSLYDFSIHGL